MDPVIFTVAAVGAELTVAEQPALPITTDDLVRDARECRAAGASIYHLHVRDEEGRPTMAVDRFRAAHDAIRDATDLIVQFTSGGAVSDTFEDRRAPLALGPEMATLTTGSVNFGDEVFLNPRPVIVGLYEAMLLHGVQPEYEIFDVAMVSNALRIAGDVGASHHQHFDFVLGVPGALAASDAIVDVLRDQLPDGATWSATGIGRAHLPVAAKAIAAGGHVRTGFEDVRYFEAGVPATSNAQLIARVAEMARWAGRDVAAPDEARDMLGLAASP